MSIYGQPKKCVQCQNGNGPNDGYCSEIIGFPLTNVDWSHANLCASRTYAQYCGGCPQMGSGSSSVISPAPSPEQPATAPTSEPPKTLTPQPGTPPAEPSQPQPPSPRPESATPGTPQTPDSQPDSAPAGLKQIKEPETAPPEVQQIEEPETAPAGVQQKKEPETAPAGVQQIQDSSLYKQQLNLSPGAIPGGTDSAPIKFITPPGGGSSGLQINTIPDSGTNIRQSNLITSPPSINTFQKNQDYSYLPGSSSLFLSNTQPGVAVASNDLLDGAFNSNNNLLTPDFFSTPIVS